MERPQCFNSWKEESEFCKICRHNVYCSEGMADNVSEAKLIEREYQAGRIDFREMSSLRIADIKRKIETS